MPDPADGRKVLTFLISGRDLDLCEPAELRMITGGLGLKGPLWRLLRAANALGLEGRELGRVSVCPKPLRHVLEVELEATMVNFERADCVITNKEEDDARAT